MSRSQALTLGQADDICPDYTSRCMMKVRRSRWSLKAGTLLWYKLYYSFGSILGGMIVTQSLAPTSSQALQSAWRKVWL